MLGRLLKTLSHLLKTEEAKWHSANSVRRKLSYGRLRGALVHVAEHPLKWLLTVLVILFLSSVGLCFVPSDWLFEAPANFNTVDLIVYFSALWSVQGAVAALVYPIVIAFVTLLLQRRHSAKAVLHIYLHDSAAIFSGLSALFLLVLMTLQYLLLTLIRIETGIAWLLLDGMWFFVNLGLTSFFLYRTFEFVRPSRRAETIRQYAINITWPRELREHLASHLFLTAVEWKFLPGPSYSIGEEKTPSVRLGPPLFNEGVPVVERLLPSDSRLTDVRFRFLAWVTLWWLRRANRSGPAKEQEGSETLQFRDQHKTPILLYPLEPGSTYSGNITLCRVIGTVPISWLEHRLVRWAFKFRRSPPLLELTVKDVLDDLKAEAMLALRDGEPQAFSGAVSQLVDFYVQLTKASTYKNTQGNLKNYACISDRHRMFDRPVYKMWSRRLVDLFNAAAERMSSDEAFFAELAYVPGRLFSRLNDATQVDMLAHFVELPRVLFDRLGNWWVKTLEQQGIIEHDACNAASLRPPFFGTYDSILRSFVGAWEWLKNNQFPLLRDETLSWPDLQDAGRYFESHLQATAAMIIECIHRGDKTGTDWILNVLLRWFSDLQRRLNVRSYFFFRHQKLISFELIKRSWEEAKGTLDVEEGGYVQESAPKALFAVALQHYWTDVCCVIAYMLAMRGKYCLCDQSLPARVLRAMVFGEVPRPDGQEIDSKEPLSNASDLLMAILRQYHAESGRYRARLDHFVERLAGVTEAARISGRIYGRWGADDLNSLRDGQLVLLTFLVPERWNPVAKAERTIRKWVREDDGKLRELVSDLKQWKERLAQPDFAEYRGLFECVKRAQAGPSFDEAIASVVAGIDELVTTIEAIRAEAIRDLTVSHSRLEEVGKWASALGFSKTSGAFPLFLFDSVGTSDRELQRRSRVVPKREKGEYTEPAMAQRSGDEEDWGEEARDCVAESILMEAIEQLAPQEEDGDSPDIYWEQMKRYAEDASRAGRQAILLIENPTIPNWIYEWTHPYRESPEETPPDLETWRDAKIKSDAYLGSLNKVAVYVAPIPPGASYLLTSESFKSVTFTRLANGNFVFVEALPTEADTALIDLRLTWWFDLDLDSYPAVKLTYGNRGRC